MSNLDRRRVIFVTKSDCPLCDQGAALLERFAPRFGVGVDVVHIENEPDFAQEYGERLPVVLGFGHRVLAEGRLTPFTVQRALVRVRLGR